MCRVVCEELRTCFRTHISVVGKLNDEAVRVWCLISGWFHDDDELKRGKVEEGESLHNTTQQGVQPYSPG